jgi:hypothetical protein
MTYFDPDKHPELEPQRPRRQEDVDDAEVPDIRRKDWEPGDRVLAPWGRAFLFAGTVNKIGEDEILVSFDDGDIGWAAEDQVRPLEMIAVGSRVECRWKGGSAYYAGVIAQMNGDQIFVHYDDGDREWSTIGQMRVPTGLPPTAWETIRGLASYAWILLILGFCLFRIWRWF